MAKNHKSANLINTVNEIISIARNREIAHLFAEDEFLNGRTITLKGKEKVNFGSCSYLGLELDPRLIEAGIDAIKRYGSQFSCTRAYVSVPLYAELEHLLGQMFGRPVILSTCSSLGHQAIMPIIVDDDDAIILDQQVHVSMQESSVRLQQRGVTLSVLRHSRLDELQTLIDELSTKHNRIWYFIDGVYSMYGDYAPIHQLIEMLNKNKKLYLYIDDAHGMSWTGIHGTGYIRSQIDLHPQMVLATSLAKGFASAGGVFVMPNEEMYWKVKNWGGALTYSGPQQPATIGASIASAKIHLSDEIYTIQNSLKEKLKYCSDIINHYDLPLITESQAPIFFIGLGLTKVGYNIVRRLSDDGLYVNLGIFPAVPETCTGIRFAITNHHTLSDIEQLAERINYHLPKALKEEDRTMQDVYRAFNTFPKFKDRVIENESKVVPISNGNPKFTLHHYTSIHQINEKSWNGLLGNNGSFDWNGLALLEMSFKDNEKKEENIDFHYYIVRDKENKPIIATFFTSFIGKDDMLAPAEVSKKIEAVRETNPYYLTSKSFMMGSIQTEGQHLYIDRSNNSWKEAMMILLDEIWVEQERQKASTLFLRDFPADDVELRDFMIDQGFIKVDVPDTHIIENVNLIKREDFFTSLHGKKRYHLKQDALKYESAFEVKIAEEVSPEDIEYWYQLYDNVRNNNLDINIFKLPKKLFYNMAASRNWEVILLYLKEDTRSKKLPVGVSFAHKTGNYCSVIFGIDYNYLHEYKVYKQLLYQTILRGLDHNAKKIFLGLTASLEKRKMGANAKSQVAYIQIKDNYNMSVIGMIPNTKRAA